MIPEVILACALTLGAVVCLRLWWILQRRFAGPLWMGVYLALPAAVHAIHAADGAPEVIVVARWAAALGAMTITWALARAIPRDIATLEADAAKAAAEQQRAVDSALDADNQRRLAQAEAGLREARQILDDLHCRHGAAANG